MTKVTQHCPVARELF